MTVLLIILAIIVGHFAIGFALAQLLASKVAICATYYPDAGDMEYEWRNSYTNTTEWSIKNPDPESHYVHKTGKVKLLTEPVFNRNEFTNILAGIRWLWFIYVPIVLGSSNSTKLLDKYSPARADFRKIEQERKISEQKAIIANLEKENEELKALELK